MKHLGILLVCVVVLGLQSVLAQTTNRPLDAATKERSLRQIAEGIKTTEAILRRLDDERDRAVKHFAESLEKLNQEQHLIREQLHAARKRLPQEKDKNQRDLILAEIKILEDEKYPALLAEIAKLNQGRIEWNSRSAERAAFRAPYEEKLQRLRAEEAELRATPVQGSIATGDGTSRGTTGGETTGGSTHADRESIYKNLQSLPAEQRREILQQMLRDVEQYERNIAAKEARVESARSDLLRLNGMPPFEKVRFSGQVMEAREAARQLNASIAESVKGIITDRAFFAGERVRIQMELAKLK